MFENDEDIQNYTTQENYEQEVQTTEQSLAAALPLQDSTDNTHRMIRDYHTLARQNFKMLLLTAPGERIMDTNFGVGIRSYLFEMSNEDTKILMANKIESQVAEYMPYIKITSITFPTTKDSILHIRIKYSIETLGVEEEISFAETTI